MQILERSNCNNTDDINDSTHEWPHVHEEKQVIKLKKVLCLYGMTFYFLN